MTFLILIANNYTQTTQVCKWWEKVSLLVGKGIGIGGKRYRYWWEKVSVLVGKGIYIGSESFSCKGFQPV